MAYGLVSGNFYASIGYASVIFIALLLLAILCLIDDNTKENN
ncbi:hypothetical protein J2Z32_003722 [Paenibacillus turicensis]|uniref:MFS transporter n=1 Tax=Paenibacillus turicensis TaxID=160487 RepID=A0ABS4FWV7_9BACL|nr:hypothetical protein [Paenibacillus turicensis]MBP1907057.1 hypothetical protein [Paenibacillus turicensis]